MSSPRPSKPPSKPSKPRTSEASLLYWLLVVCGLAGLTFQRIDAPFELAPLWVGTVAGVGLGQLVAWLRVRTWVLAVVGMGVLWISPFLLFVLYGAMRPTVEMGLYAFLPAALCGYLSLSERGGLVAFWYPAVLWMLVILDSPGAAAAGTFDKRAALPLIVGLTALSIAFLRARETRRVAIWHSNATARLAKPLPPAVLRASPLRAASQHAWTACVGASALVLAAWVAPHLWQKDQAKHTTIAQRQEAQAGMWETGPTAAPLTADECDTCCAESAIYEANRVRVREYLLSRHGQDEEVRRIAASTSCYQCRERERSELASFDATYNATHSGSQGGSLGGGTVPDLPGRNLQPTSAQSTPLQPITPPPPPVIDRAGAPPKPLPENSPIAGAVTPPKPPAAPNLAVPPATPKASPQAVAPSTKSARPSALVVPASAPLMSGNAPWRSMLAFCFGGLGLHLLARAVRRQLTLRHLERPFWSETLDQRISNHWQRMLVGLRDAGIHAKHDEQPEALAKRVGIEGMETCATILERVRHGVRVDAEDLDAMDSAADTAYRAARQKAGIAGRAAGWVRWPLA